jgi:hypothetical protein
MGKSELKFLGFAFTMFPVLLSAKVYDFKLYEKRVVNGLAIELVRIGDYHPMTGRSAVFFMEYKGRKSYIGLGYATCANVEETYYFEGYSFNLKDFNQHSTDVVILDITRDEIKGRHTLFQEEQITKLRRILMERIGVPVGFVGNMSGYKVFDTDEAKLYMEYRYRPHLLQPSDLFLREIEIYGQFGPNPSSSIRFSIIVDRAGRYMIQSYTVKAHEERLESCLRWILEQFSE